MVITVTDHVILVVDFEDVLVVFSDDVVFSGEVFLKDKNFVNVFAELPISQTT